MSLFKKSVAARENVKLKIGIAGPSGSGKTFSALQLAYGITGNWSKVTVVDTENSSALYYADGRPFGHVPFDPDQVKDGYHPKNWVTLIAEAEKDPDTEVLILDSISHEWEGKGGCLQIQERLGGRYTDWAKVTPLHASFIDALRLSKIHIIATMRSKQDYVVEQNERGKSEPKKVGLKSIQREGADYEFGVVFDVDMTHHARSGKDRTGLFADRTPFRLAPEHGKELKDWASSAVANEVVVVYDPTNDDDKRWLAKQLPNFQREDLKRVSDRFAGRPRSELDAVVEGYLAESSMI